jgi:hypothetical protein
MPMHRADCPAALVKPWRVCCGAIREPDAWTAPLPTMHGPNLPEHPAGDHLVKLQPRPAWGRVVRPAQPQGPGRSPILLAAGEAGAERHQGRTHCGEPWPLIGVPRTAGIGWRNFLAPVFAPWQSGSR